MINITKERLNNIKRNFLNKKIAVIGDMMLDGYYWGDVNRISPEAPVPVIEVGEEFFRFGGAANVALNIKTLGGIPIPIGIVGKDNDGKIFRSLLSDVKMKSDGIIFDSTRPTTAKTRVIANNQHVVRIDKEEREYISPVLEKKIINFLTIIVKDLDGIILQDYNKGVLTETLIKKIITLGNKHKKIIAVDPKFNNFFAYSGATIFKPNKKETEDALSIRLDTKISTKKAGEKLMKKLKVKYVMITLGQDGVAIFDGSKPEMRIPTKARKIRDVSGAGDTVISTLTLALAAGANIYEAAYLANYAGGLACEEVGIVPIELSNLFIELESNL
ncbi:D-glycero-beta-D-manno-heptose-7-phosphate kinase [Bacteroidota bacterium]